MYGKASTAYNRRIWTGRVNKWRICMAAAVSVAVLAVLWLAGLPLSAQENSGANHKNTLVEMQEPDGGMGCDREGKWEAGVSDGDSAEEVQGDKLWHKRDISVAAQEREVLESQEADKELIILDPGHGGMDEGCSRDGVLEKEINLQLAKLVRDKLEELGYEVLLLREEDTELTLEERVNMAELASADLYISIHQNACEESAEVEGIEVWYCSDKQDESKRLAQLIHNETIKQTEGRDRGLIDSNELYVIRETSMPSCLIETGFLSNPKERELLTTTEYQEQIAAGITQGIEWYFHPKTMYLTFDDGPSEENTTAILDTLKEHNIKATFFVVGENVRKHPEIAKRIVEEGHTIGIHCNSHEYEEIYASVDCYVADFEEAYSIVKEVTGVEARLFRFPGGSINAYNKRVYKDIIEEMTERGYIYFDWNASLEDAVKKAEPEVLLKNAKESTLGRRKVVMLAHDMVHSTAVCLEELIQQFPEYRMEPLTEEVSPIHF